MTEYTGYNTRTEWPTPEIAALISANIIKVKDRVLDIGCGHGTESIFLAMIGCGVVGIDNDEEAIKKLRNRARKMGVRVGKLSSNRISKKGIDIVPPNKADALRFGEQISGTFDVAIDRLVLNNIDSVRKQKQLIGTAAYALKPGGVFIIRTSPGHDEPSNSRSYSLLGDNWGPVPLRYSVLQKDAMRSLKIYFELGPEVRFAGMLTDPLQAEGALIVCPHSMALLVARRKDDTPFRSKRRESWTHAK